MTNKISDIFLQKENCIYMKIKSLHKKFLEAKSAYDKAATLQLDLNKKVSSSKNLLNTQYLDADTAQIIIDINLEFADADEKLTKSSFALQESTHELLDAFKLIDYRPIIIFQEEFGYKVSPINSGSGYFIESTSYMP